MAFNSWILNKVPSSGGRALYEIMTMLESAGWVVSESSDGSSVSPNNTNFSTGYNNPYAWFRATCPNGISELGFQRGGSGEQYCYIKYSPGGFTSGGTSTSLPSSVDQVNVFGDNSSGAQLFQGGSTYYLQGGADSGITAGDGYGFWVVGYSASDQAVRTCIIMEPVVATDPLDTNTGERYMFYIGYANNSVFDNNHLGNIVGGAEPRWAGYLGSSSFVNIPACYPRTNPGYTFGSNPYSGKDDRIPMLFVRRPGWGLTGGAAVYGYKGISSMIMYEYTTRSVAQTKGNKTRITFGGDATTKLAISLPWDGTTVPKV